MYNLLLAILVLDGFFLGVVILLQSGKGGGLAAMGGGVSATEGILAAVQRCGEILQAHLPAAPRNLNQLPTALILED